MHSFCYVITAREGLDDRLIVVIRLKVGVESVSQREILGTGKTVVLGFFIWLRRRRLGRQRWIYTGRCRLRFGNHWIFVVRKESFDIYRSWGGGWRSLACVGSA